MGNRNSHLSSDDIEERVNFHKIIDQFLNEDKTSYNYITDFRKDSHHNFLTKKKKIEEKSNLRESLNHEGLKELTLEIISSLVNTSLNHEVNSTMYKAVTLPKITDNNNIANEFDIELLGNQSAYLIQCINKMYLSDKIEKYDNWIPIEKSDKFLIDKLEEDCSSIIKDDNEDDGKVEYTDIIDKNELSLEKDLTTEVIRKSQNKEVNDKFMKDKLNNRPSLSVDKLVDNISHFSPISKIIGNKIINKVVSKKNKSAAANFYKKTVNSLLNVRNKKNYADLKLNNNKKPLEKNKLKKSIVPGQVSVNNHALKNNYPSGVDNIKLTHHQEVKNKYEQNDQETILGSKRKNKILNIINPYESINNKESHSENPSKLNKQEEVSKSRRIIPSRSPSMNKKGASMLNSNLHARNNQKNQINYEKEVMNIPVESYDSSEEKNFADLILKHVSPLRTKLKKSDKNKFDFFLDADQFSEEKEKIIKPKSKEKIEKITHNNNDHRKARIRIDLRSLMENIEDSWKSSSILPPLNDKSKSRPKNYLTVKGSKNDKMSPDSDLRTTFRIKKTLASNNENSNLNLNIHINSNKINTYNNYASTDMSKSPKPFRSHAARLNNTNINNKMTFGITDKSNSIVNNNVVSAEQATNSPKLDFKQFVGNFDLPKFDLDLSPLEQTGKNTLSFNEVLKQLKHNNKFLFEVTNEEKLLNEKIKALNCDEK